MSSFYKKGIILVLLVPVFSQTICQDTYYHPSILGANFSSYQFKQNSKNIPFVPGVGVQYISSVNSFLDWSVKLDGAFTNEILKSFSSDKKLFLKSDALLRARIIPRESRLQPFVSSGVEGANYDGNNYVFIPFDAGIEFNYRNIFVLLTAGYRHSFTQKLNSFCQYGIGISGFVATRKKRSFAKSTAYSDVPLDSDGDGIIDSEDSCRETPGILKFNGCPDTDGDGIEDKKDRCPFVFGIAKYNGCPVTDTDKDGIYDDEDSCIYVPGVLNYHGCPVPDTDGDGINDEEDSCVNVPGLKQNKGCPLISKEITEKIDKAARSILFKTGSYQLLESSYQVLNKVVSILNEDPELKLLIEGHTDNQGTEKSNQLLSEKRASAVREYLTQKGISETRLRAAGYGQTRPIDTNITAEGRLSNRRVELVLSY